MEESMSMKRNTKRGSITVEAAIILPIFIIAALTIGYCINSAAASESVINLMCDEARKSACEMYLTQKPLGIRSGILNRYRDETLFVDDLKIDSVTEHEDIVTVSSSYKIKNRMPIRLRKDMSYKQNIMYRGFTGADNRGELFTFDMMEEDDGSSIVWVFPVAGEVYHKESCPYIKVCPRQVVLSPEIREKYEPCQLCNPGDLSDGRLVYCFLSSGTVYHTGDCTTVDRYVVPMTRSQAEKEGYGPCVKCGG